MKPVVLDQSRTALAILLVSSLVVTCGCEVHVAMGVGDEAPDSPVDLVSGRLKRAADESVSADQSDDRSGENRRTRSPENSTGFGMASRTRKKAG